MTVLRQCRPRVFFICGSINQTKTTQMHQIARELDDCDVAFSPYYGDARVRRLRELGLAECSIAGKRLRARCLECLLAHGLGVDLDGARGSYDLIFTCVFSSGSTDAMIANCDVPITQFSSVVFVGLALGKEVHSQHPLEVRRRLLPAQNGRAARNIAALEQKGS